MRIFTWSVAALAALLAVPILLVALLDWNLLKPWLSRQFSVVLSREIRVDGPISLSWSLAPSSPQGGVSWLPQLHLTAQDLQIGNPAWAHSADHLLRAQRLDLHFSPLPLLRWHWHVTDLRIDGLDLVMERLDEHHKNWRFSDQPRSRWSFDIHQIVFDHALIRYVDQPLDLDLRFDVRPLTSDINRAAALRDQRDQRDDGALVLQAAVSGRYGQAPVQGQLRGGALPDLLNQGSVYPLQAEGEVGAVQTIIHGNLIEPHHLQRADLRIRLSGDSLDRLYAATGIPLPSTQPFSTNGQLTITRVDTETRAWNWRYEHFRGKVGDSDFAGDATYYRGPPK
ncbi:AsmA family protein, partial [Herbaspirillum sp. B65]